MSVTAILVIDSLTYNWYVHTSRITLARQRLSREGVECEGEKWVQW